jgi:WhiB family redox-sensing transcriptional regulator
MSLDFPINTDDVAWQDRAACKGRPLSTFVPDGQESPTGLATARAWCNPCPVRPQCLAWATRHRCVGYWGGTNTFQRNQLLRVRTRAKCPLCLSQSLVSTDTHELCVACGASWVRDVRLEPIAATPLPAEAA